MQINDEVIYDGKKYSIYNETCEDKGSWLLAPDGDSDETDFVTIRKSELNCYLLKQASAPLMKFLCDNFHPHVTAIVTPSSSELMEGISSTGLVMDYVRD